MKKSETKNITAPAKETASKTETTSTKETTAKAATPAKEEVKAPLQADNQPLPGQEGLGQDNPNVLATEQIQQDAKDEKATATADKKKLEAVKKATPAQKLDSIIDKMQQHVEGKLAADSIGYLVDELKDYRNSL
jgi:hypothetical protein